MGGSTILTHCRLPPQALDPGTGTIVSNNRFVGQYEIQNDGSFVEGGPSEGQTMVGNWASNSGKLGLRYDGIPGPQNGTMARNVLWDCGPMKVKGDYHGIYNNTLFDMTTVNIFGPGSTFDKPPQPQDSLDRGVTGTAMLDLDNTGWSGENAHTVVSGNLADTITATDIGVQTNNMFGYPHFYSTVVAFFSAHHVATDV